MGAMIELLFWYKKRIAYNGRVFNTSKAAKRGRFFAASVKRRRKGGRTRHVYTAWESWCSLREVYILKKGSRHIKAQRWSLKKCPLDGGAKNGMLTIQPGKQANLLRMGILNSSTESIEKKYWTPICLAVCQKHVKLLRLGWRNKTQSERTNHYKACCPIRSLRKIRESLHFKVVLY